MFRGVLGLLLMNGGVLRVFPLHPPPPGTGLRALGVRVIEGVVMLIEGHIYKFSYYWL